MLEFDSSGNIISSAGTYNTVSKIDTELSSLQSSVTTNTSDITTLLSGGTIFTSSGSYTVPSNGTTLTIEAMGGGGGGSSGGTGSDGAWAGDGRRGSGALEKITIPVTSGQVTDFTIGVGGAGGAQLIQSRGNGTATTVTMERGKGKGSRIMAYLTHDLCLGWSPRSCCVKWYLFLNLERGAIKHFGVNPQGFYSLLEILCRHRNAREPTILRRKSPWRLMK